MFRPLVTWVRRNKSKTIYCLFAIALVTLLLNNRGPTKNGTLNSFRLDFTQNSAGNNPRFVGQEKESGDSQPVKSAPFAAKHIDEDPNYLRRQEVALKACQQISASSKDWLEAWPMMKKEPYFQHDPMISTKTKLFYCPVGKVASSFFTRWVLAMNKPGPMASPYDIAMKDAGRGRAESLATLPKDKRLDFLHSSTRVVFGRNPYSRIFSAYVDKLFSPNPFYWDHWGKRSIEMDNHKTFTKCGSGVTFAQFVNAVVEEIAKKDVHLIPVSKECNTCQMHYNVIGKLENTIEDLDYASKLLNISSSFQHQPSYKSVAQKDVILDSVHSAFSWKSSIRRCGVSLDEMGQRMWRKFQIRGVIDNAIRYPLKSGSIDRMSSVEFIKICEEAIKNSTDAARLKRQRKEAMRSAYASIPKDLVAKIKDVYELDFVYFGYEKEQDFISDMNATDLSDNSLIFQWREPWTVS